MLGGLQDLTRGGLEPEDQFVALVLQGQASVKSRLVTPSLEARLMGTATLSPLCTLVEPSAISR